MTSDHHRGRWSHATPMLMFACTAFAFGDLLFGLDTGSFGSLQALPSFLRMFGTQNAQGKWVLETSRKSMMNSFPWLGKITGTLLFEPLVERIGYKKMMYFCAFWQFLGIVIEMTAPEWIAFTVGRVLTYLAAGMIENCVPSYQTEVSPAPLRGFFTGSFMFLVTLGNLWGMVMGRAFATEPRRRGYLIPVAMQLIPPAIMMVLIPFTPESPRWLISKDRKEQALHSLERLRPKKDVASGVTYSELEAMSQALAESRQVEEGRWIELFQGSNLRRTMLAMWTFFFMQASGTQFVLSYGPTFYTSMGLGTLAFTYSVVSMAVSLVAIMISMLILDRVGRRPIMIYGFIMQMAFMLMTAGLATKANPTKADINGVVAGLIMFTFAARMSINTIAFLFNAEVGSYRLRKKSMTAASSFDVLSAFVVTFSVPYLLGRPGANLGPNVAWIFSGICGAAVIFSIVLFPELKGRSLEETDELFNNRLWAWQFSKAKTTGIGARMAALENGEVEGLDEKAVAEWNDKDVAKVEHVEVSQDDINSKA